MKNAQELRENMGALHDRAKALTTLADKEKRDLTEAETKDFDGWIADYKAIEETSLPRAEWLEAEEERLAEVRQPGGGVQRHDDPDNPKNIIIPVNTYRAGKLKAFSKPEDAYLAGQFLRASLGKNDAAKLWCKDHGVPLVRNALSGGDNSLGGYLVPDEMERRMIVLLEQYGVFRQFAGRVVMSSDTYLVPRRTTGITVYFSGENAALTASDPTLDGVQLNAKKMTALIKYSSEISEDAIISVADWLTREIAYGFAVKEDACGFLGDGTSTYGGIVGLIKACTTATATVVTAAPGNTAFSTLDLSDFESMVGLLPEYPGIDPAWFISKGGWAGSMMRLQDAAGGNTMADLGTGPGKVFLGYPVAISQSMNSTLGAQVSTNGLAYFGDLNLAATFGIRRGFGIETSTERYFEYDQLGIKGTQRVDINVHDVGNTSNAGAMIMLATPAS